MPHGFETSPFLSHSSLYVRVVWSGKPLRCAPESQCCSIQVGLTPCGVSGLLAHAQQSFLVGESFNGNDACVVMRTDFCLGEASKADSSEALAPNCILGRKTRWN